MYFWAGLRSVIMALPVYTHLFFHLTSVVDNLDIRDVFYAWPLELFRSGGSYNYISLFYDIPIMSPDLRRVQQCEHSVWHLLM